ncbi:MAG: transposase [Thiohalocapsa sp.]
MAQGRRPRAQWRQLVEGLSDGGGVTQAQYCQRHGISVASFHRWRDHFRQAQVAEGARAQASSRSAEPQRLVPVQLLGEAVAVGAAQALTLVFANGVRVQVSPGFDAATLARVVGLLQEGSLA